MRKIALIGYKGDKGELIASGSAVPSIRKKFKELAGSNCGSYDEVFIYETYTKRKKSKVLAEAEPIIEPIKFEKKK